MGLLSISTLLLSLLCLAGLMAAAMVVASIWSHNRHISQEGWIEEPKMPEAGPSEQLIDEVCELSQSGQKIEAIKLYRQNTGAGLVEAKEAVEALECNDD
jgi:ribosomal protein L7/L12